MEGYENARGRPLMRETHQVRRRRCRNDDTFRDVYFETPEPILSIGACESRRKISFRRPHPLSLPTTTLPYDNRHDTCTYAVPWKLRLYDW